MALRGHRSGRFGPVTLAIYDEECCIGNSRGNNGQKPCEIRYISRIRRRPLYFGAAGPMIVWMNDRKTSDRKETPQNTDARRTSHSPAGSSKNPAASENPPKSSPDAAIPPEKLNAGNDK
jgi:hypothetical protein